MKFTRTKKGSGVTGSTDTYTIEMSNITGDSIQKYIEEKIKHMKETNPRFDNPRHCLITLNKGLKTLKNIETGSFKVDKE